MAPLKSCLGIFVREPRPGRAKTRLIPALGADGAASLYRAFVEDTLNLALAVRPRHCRLWTDGAPPDEHVSGVLRPVLAEARADGRLDDAPQPEGDLGVRLDAAVRAADADGTGPLLVIGTDSPDLPARHLGSALAALDGGADVVLGAAADGGVWCIGLARPVDGFFDDLPWSTDSAGDALRHRTDALGLRRAEAPAWYDCDTPEDLPRLVTRLRDTRDRAKMTWQWLEHHGLT